MLTKLLQYEFKTGGRIILPIAAGVLLLNLFSAIASRFIQNVADSMPLVGISVALLNFAAMLSLLAVLAICFFMEVRQFYRLLGDCGYLMLALPVPTWKHIASKVICGTVWTLFGMLFFTLCASCTALSYDEVTFDSVTPEDMGVFALLFLILAACIVGALLHTYLACAFASQFTQQRLLISICSYFVIGFIGQMAAVVFAVLLVVKASTFPYVDEMTSVSICPILLVVLLCTVLVDALLWALTQWFMTKRLNLA